jgi:hypothetical protein
MWTGIMSREGKSETSTPESCRLLTAEGDLEHDKEVAIALVQRCVRNTQLEDLHAGFFRQANPVTTTM